MTNHRTHHVTTTDGVIIGGTVHGEGPALVFVHGMLADGDVDWQALLPHLGRGFTCHLPSWRGRGLSGDHPDLGFGRMVDDVLAYVDSIGEVAGVVGWSFGGNLALVAAAQPDAIPAVAAIGPVAMSLAGDEGRVAFGGAVARTAELAGRGDLTAAARAIARLPFSDEEIAAADAVGYFEAAGRYVPNLLNLLQQWMEYQGPTIDDPAVLGAIAGRVLVLPAASSPFHRISAQHVIDHIPDPRVQELPGAGHAAPLTHAEALAEALTRFFAPAQLPA